MKGALSNHNGKNLNLVSRPIVLLAKTSVLLELI
jgi:hypothetical protein